MSDKSSKMETRGNCENFSGQKHGGKTFFNFFATYKSLCFLIGQFSWKNCNIPTEQLHVQ